MARLGIVIGVSENLPPLKSLTACANDAAVVSDVLKQTGRFDDLLILAGKAETASTAVKEKLTAFVGQYKGTEVDELIFYFSGHGDFAGSEFYHILSDYDGAARNRTSLSNSELDEMIRGLAPKLFVKIVDACHSGTSYIKSGEGLGEYLKGARTGFQEVYFLYSSQSDQVSWTAGALSAFTRCIISEVGRRSSGPIRYRDLMSAASDYFEAAGDQTPHFVTQADFTQVFCNSSPAMQAVVQKYLPPPPSGDAGTPGSSGKRNSSLIELIREKDEQSCSREEAINILEDLRQTFSANKLPDELQDIFEWKLTSANEKMADVIAVGDWLSKNSDRGYFASPEYKTVTYKKRVRKHQSGIFTNFKSSFQLSRLLGPDYIDDEPEFVEATRHDISDYSNTCSLPYQRLTVRLEPKFKSVLPLDCLVVPILSLSHLRLFWTVQEYKRTDWDTTVPTIRSVNWDSDETPLKNPGATRDLADRITSAFKGSVEKFVYSNWPDAKKKLPASSKKS
ncbi:caspase domain-containing protein [Rhizobium ruizarguesonis]